MKVYSLIFDYQLDKMISSGRIWSHNGYKNKDYIFSYSAASIATFLEHNPKIIYEILTDDVELLLSKINEYDVDTSFLMIKDAHDLINTWKQHPHCFWPLVSATQYMMDKNQNERVVKLDNDLTCLKPLDDTFMNHVGSIVWKFERVCSKGRQYWGESIASKRAFGTSDYNIYNTGVLSFDHLLYNEAKEISSLSDKLSRTDVSDILAPEIANHTKVWSCSDQTTNCYWIHKHSTPVLETYTYFDHHCYVHGKEETLKRATHLLKGNK